jgi:hypothetical protein
LFHASFSNHQYSTWALPLWVTILGALLCLIAGGLLVAQGAMGREPGARPWLWGFAAVPAGGALVLALGLAPPGATHLFRMSHDALEGAGPLPTRVFGDLFAGELLLWAAAVAALGLAALIRCGLGGRPDARELAPALAVAIPGLLLALAGPAHSTALLAWGPLPVLEAHDGARVHVGRSLDLEPRVHGLERPERCALAPLVFTPSEPGEASLSARAHCGMLGVERSVTVSAGEDRGPELFPLAPGHTWTWRHVREWHNHMLWFFPEHGRSEGPALHLGVAAFTESAGLGTWELEEWAEDSEDPQRLEHQVYRWNGELLRLREGTPTDEPFFALVEPPEGEHPIRPAEGDEPAWRACTLDIFPRSTCRCLVEPHGEAALGGPSLCARDPGPGDGIRALGSALLAAVTVGLVIVDPDQDPRWVLQRSGASGSEADLGRE